MSDLLAGLIEANIAVAAAILVVMLLRGHVRRLAGAHAAYLLWALVPVAMAATLIPARIGPVVFLDNTAMARAALGELSVAPDVAKAVAQVDWIGLALAALPFIWLVGMVVALFRTVWRQAQFAGDVRHGLAGPAVMGVFRPRIVTPADFAERYDSEERELILDHEGVHLRRGDALVNTLTALAQCVCWFNPLVHVGARLMRIDQELSCDAAVMERRPEARRAYAETLLKTQLAARPLPVGCYWPAGAQHPLTERVAMLAREPLSRRRKLAAGAAVVALAMLGGCAAWVAQPERKAERDSAAPIFSVSRDQKQPIFSAMNPQDPYQASYMTSLAKRSYETYQRVYELLGGRFPRPSDTDERYNELLGDRWVDADRVHAIFAAMDTDVENFLEEHPVTRLLPQSEIEALKPGETSALDVMKALQADYNRRLEQVPVKKPQAT